MVAAATVATYAQTRFHSALTPGLALPSAHGAALCKEETEGGCAGPRTVGLGAELGREPGWPSLVTAASVLATTIAQSEVLRSRPSSVSGALSSLQAPPRINWGACSEAGSEGALSVSR